MGIVRQATSLRVQRATNIFQWSAGAIAILGAACLLWLLVRRICFGTPLDYTAVGELLLVLVIAVEGGVAISALKHDQRSARAVANAGVFDLYKTYLSVDYHQNVRRPAWYAVSRAMTDSEYREKILGGLAGQLSGEEVRDAYERKRGGKKLNPEDAESFQFHDEYHRVQDVLGFYSMLSALSREADAEIVQTCNFFYDRWRVQLHRIVQMLGEYQPSDETVKQLKLRRWKVHRDTLMRLDKVFDLEHIDWQNDPLSQIVDANRGGLSVEN
ncbi:MAG: hypothetical protein WAO35_01465 [Terriglobia bacterium]